MQVVVVDVSVVEEAVVVVVTVVVVVIVPDVVVSVAVVLVVVTPQSAYSPAACFDSTSLSPAARLRQFVTDNPVPPRAAPSVCAAGRVVEPPCGRHASLSANLQSDGSRRQIAPAIASLVRSHDAASPEAAITTTASDLPPFSTLQATSSPALVPGQTSTTVLIWLIAGAQNAFVYWSIASGGRFPTWYANETWFFEPSVSPACGSK